jgi:manganese transport protein
VLSFGIPFALVPLVLLTRRQDIMGRSSIRRLTTVVAFDRGRAHHRAQRSS